ncbi:ATP-binding domain-containing protein [Paracoccus sp. DMF-8]|uniref:ATP-binding domain-containing protein n=1 Tax=Paracoccus sp. DMF-8 TaxID=3019445 RepID=UPI0023E7F895|nr:ATP-binding domain-containing protein [Paracoccus sp. DMF-8]MDF3606537.1 ATP-binding domain-containing protein [Paracoccus sp. DMF-8]
MVKWSPQQVAALETVSAWHKECEAERRAGKRLSAPVMRVFGYAGTGKAQPISQIVYTPHGPRRIGDLKVGDQVFGRDGRPCTVEGVFPQGVKPVWRITFRDGATTRCCPDHLWSVTTHKGVDRVMSTKEILASGLRFESGPHKFRIPLCRPVEFPEADLPVPPYVLGALIGDGYLSGSIVALSVPKHKEDVLDRVMAELGSGYSASINSAPPCPQAILCHGGCGTPNPLRRALRDLGLLVRSPDRFVPDVYLHASVNQRLDLLRGLMDTDGTSRGNRIGFSSSSKKLAEAVAYLTRSLGGTAIISRQDRRGASEWGVNVKLAEFCPFHCREKASGWSASRKNPPSRCIWSIEPDGEEDQVCIKVSSSDRLYLTDDFIVTHNTTLARSFAEGISGHTCYAAFTGKAALMMARNGCHDASTIHGLIYQVVELPDGRVTFLKDPDSAANGAALIVIDECSMVDEQIGRDLMSFGAPILVLGDPAQLPPVSGAGFFTEAQPDVMLTEIHRQAEENPIIRLATAARQGEALGIGSYGDSRVVSRGTLEDEEVLSASQVLVGKNATRRGFNAKIRRLLGRNSSLPERDDRLVCLRNDNQAGIFNGGLFTAMDDAQGRRGKTFDMVVASDDFPGRPSIKVKVHRDLFGPAPEDLDWKELKGTQQFDFGYALTCHKAQGSQWPDVVIYDESGIFRDDARRWLYTALTRASERVTVVSGAAA